MLVRPFVQKTANAVFLKTLAYALRRTIQQTHQVEQLEIAVELIGRDEHQRIMMWEAAEGGFGVWERLVDDPEPSLSSRDVRSI